MIYKPLIIKKVNDHHSIKSVDLALSVITEVGPGRFERNEYAQDLVELLDEGYLIELTYITLNGDIRPKSIYFPQGTSFEFHNKQR